MPGGKVRLFTRNKDVYFTNPVHELLEPSLTKAKIPIYPSKVVVHHYGKLDEVRDWQKGEDYYLLGKMKYENDPTNVKYILELAKQAQLLQKNEEAMELWLKLLSFIENDHQSQAYKEITRITYGDPISEIYTMLTASYMALNRFGEALLSARKSMETKEKKRKEYVNVYAQIEIIAGSLEKAFSALEEQLKIMPDYSPALTLTAVIFHLEGKNEEAQKIFKILRAKQFEATSLLNRIARRLYANKKKDDAMLIINLAIESKISNAETQKMLEEFQKG
jgi:thioredoxin-like negative regulator of GroEL